MTKGVIPVWKPQGWTPVMVVEDFKKNNPELHSQKISYAGRLDPMAEGMLLLLVGDENKNRHAYEKLKKSYQSEIVLGLSTDTYDALGIIAGESVLPIPSIEEVAFCLNLFIGKQEQVYPPYSSKAIQGKPLFWWARNGLLSEIELPKRSIEIYTLDLLDSSLLPIIDLKNLVIERVSNVQGDFRQKEIISSWENFSEKNKTGVVLRVSIEISCSSGTYIRGLASSMGAQLGCRGFALSITRTRIGDYFRQDCVTPS